MLTFLDFFSGIGGFRLGMEQAGHKCLGHCEIDKYANISYNAIHQPKEGEWFATDIRGVSPGDLPDADVFCGGFPCQAFSIAGKRRGFEDMRGTLVFEIFRLAKVKRPKILFLENVEGLFTHEGGQTFGTILAGMDELGYDAEWQLLNSKDYVPQNRERVFIVGHLRGGSGRKVFPIGGSNEKTLEQIIPGADAERVYDPKGLSRTLMANGGGWGAKTGLYMVNVGQEMGVRSADNALCLDANYFKGLGANQARTGVMEARPCLTPGQPEKRQNGRRIKEDGEPMFTLTAQDKHGVMIVRDGTKKGFTEFTPTDETSIDLSVPGSTTRRGRVKDGLTGALDTGCNVGVFNNARIRKLTPRECFRLQGFPDWAFDRAKAAGVSDSQLYKQAGNSVTVNVIHEIARRLK